MNKSPEIFNRVTHYLSFQSAVARSFSKYIVLLIAIIVIILIVSVKSQARVFSNNFDNSITFITNVLGKCTEDATVSNDFVFLDHLVDTLIETQDDLLYVIIIGSDDKVLTSSFHSYVSKNTSELDDVFSVNAKNDKNEVVLRKENAPFLIKSLEFEKEEIIKEIYLLKNEDKKLIEFIDLESIEDAVTVKKENIKKLYKTIINHKKNEEKQKTNKNYSKMNSFAKLGVKQEKELNKVSTDLNKLIALKELYTKLKQTEKLINKIPKDNLVYEVSAPIGKVVGQIRIGYSPKNLRNTIDQMYLISTLVGSLFVVIAFIIALQLGEERMVLEKTVEERTSELNSSLRKLEDVNLHLQEALQHKNRFLNTMSHELRTPLNAVIGFTDMLKYQYYGKLNDRQQEYVKLINDGGQHLLSLVNDILDIAKIDSGSMEFQPEDISPHDSIANVVSLMKAQYKAKGVDLITEVPVETDIILADNRKFKQIMLNLLSNALKYTESGGKVIINTEKIDDDHLRFNVIDTGCGIKQEDLENIFHEFYQTDQTRELALGGTGIGLALCKKLVEMHGGKIDVTSELGEGSIFWFTLLISDNIELKHKLAKESIQKGGSILTTI